MKKFISLLLMIFSVCIFFVSCSESSDKNSNETLDKKNLTYDYFNSKVNTNEYYWVIRFDGQGGAEQTLTVATKNGKNYNKLEKSDITEIQIFKDGCLYTVLEGDEMYMMEEKEVDESYRIEYLKSTGINKDSYNVGKKTIGNIDYYYEEFESENSRDRYYFSGEELKFIEFINSSGSSKMIEILKAENSVDDSLFEIPEHYKLKAY